MFLRDYEPADAETLAAVYRDAVTGTGSAAYDARQIAVWAAYPEDIEDFRKLLDRGLTIVAVQAARPVASGQLHPVDHIALLYTASAHSRRGYAEAIYRRLEREANEQQMGSLHTEASRVARPFFLKLGFRVVETEIAERRGVPFERFRMVKRLGPAWPGARSPGTAP
jgi:putative acetyltransferase